MSWPSGITHRFHYLPVDQALTVVEPQVTVGPGSGISGEVVEGRTVAVTLELVNHTGVSQAVWHVPQVRVSGELLWSGPVSGTTVPGSGSASLVHTLNIPLGTEGLHVEFLWAVYDAGSGVDQMSAPFEIQGGLLRNSNGGSNVRRLPRARR